jgi:hypothetical protein
VAPTVTATSLRWAPSEGPGVREFAGAISRRLRHITRLGGSRPCDSSSWDRPHTIRMGEILASKRVLLSTAHGMVVRRRSGAARSSVIARCKNGGPSPPLGSCEIGPGTSSRSGTRDPPCSTERRSHHGEVQAPLFEPPSFNPRPCASCGPARGGTNRFEHVWDPIAHPRGSPEILPATIPLLFHPLRMKLLWRTVT